MNSYLKAGIDHGTTNSSIAILDSRGPRALKVDGNSDLMPSYVYLDRKGRVLVGARAYRAALVNDPAEGDGISGYKLRIGQGYCYELPAARKSLLAPEVGAIVLGELLKVYRQECNEEIRACVITVPAKFEQNACEGTREAARRAGLVYAPLLQEPIAAALAYGFAVRDERAQWLVFDLGGGTLDCSLVMVREGRLAVPEEGHAGDNMLGGRKFDRELFDLVVRKLAEQGYDLGGQLTEQNKAYRPAYGKLLLAVEQAKIELSRNRETTVAVEGGPLCRDRHGRAVEVEVVVTRAEYDRLIEADVEKAIVICQNLIEKNRLQPSDIGRLILVGGPTHTPLIRQMLAERLRIPLDTAIDPMTAVAQGAALYAQTCEVPDEARDQVSAPVPQTPPGALRIQLQHEPHSSVPTYSLVGKVDGSAVPPGGLFVEITRSDRGWSSGRIPLDGTGLFTADLRLIAAKQATQSKFLTRALDAQGRCLAWVEGPAIWHPFPGGEVRSANSLAVAVENNQVERLIKLGSVLPGRGRAQLETTKDLKKGSKDDLLRIPVLQGVTHMLGAEDDAADCHIHVGTLTIVGSDRRVVRDLPAGSAIDVTIHQNESREVRVQAHVPMLNADFEAQFKAEPCAVDLEQLEKRLGVLKLNLDKCQVLNREKRLPAASAALDKLNTAGIVPGIAREIERAKGGEIDALSRVHRNILELAGAVNHLQRLQVHARMTRRIEVLQGQVRDHNASELADIQREYQAAQHLEDAEALRKLDARLDNLDYEVRIAPVLDVLLDVAAFPDSCPATPDQLEAFRATERLFKEVNDAWDARGREAITEDQIDRCRRAHERLMRLWPQLPQWRKDRLAEWRASGRRLGPGETNVRRR